MNLEEHWERIYRTNRSQGVSWFRPHLDTSLELIEGRPVRQGTRPIPRRGRCFNAG